MIGCVYEEYNYKIKLLSNYKQYGFYKKIRKVFD